MIAAVSCSSLAGGAPILLVAVSVSGLSVVPVRVALLAEVKPWARRSDDSRWAAEAVLLQELRGDDPDSPRAHVVYDLTLGLVSAFDDLAKVNRAIQATIGLAGADATALEAGPASQRCHR